MQTSIRMLEVYIGAFVLGGLILVMGMILSMTGGVSSARDSYIVQIRINSIGDLRRGAPVKIGGYVIGQVSEIELQAHDILIVTHINPKVNLADDCTARIATSGLVGDSFLEIVRGESDTYLPKSRERKEASVIEGETFQSMGEMFAKVESIGDQLEEMIGNVNKLIGDPQVQEDIKGTIANANTASGELVVVVKRVSESTVEIQTAITRGVTMIDQLEGIAVTVNKALDDTLGDPEQIKAIRTTVESMGAISSELAENREALGKALRNVEEITAHVSGITKSIRPDQGILGVISDPQVGAEFRGAMAGLQRMLLSMSQVGLSGLLADKYIGDKIAEQWLAENRHLTPGQKAVEWERFRQRINAIGGMMLHSNVPGSGGSN